MICTSAVTIGIANGSFFVRTMDGMPLFDETTFQGLSGVHTVERHALFSVMIGHPLMPCVRTDGLASACNHHVRISADPDGSVRVDHGMTYGFYFGAPVLTAHQRETLDVLIKAILDNEMKRLIEELSKVAAV